MPRLDACIYCTGAEPRNRSLAKRLRDTRANRTRELSLYRALFGNLRPSLPPQSPPPAAERLNRG